MLEWTGERFLPWIRESAVAYEHLHRYAYASTLVKHKRVLDLACGEGYGSKMLSATASAVVGIDIDENSVRHASSKYSSSNLQFFTGSVTAVPIEEPHSFDAIVCFEAIEHIEDQDALLAEVKRLIKSDGLFMVSTPNKAIYHDLSNEENPFHVKELYFEEFQSLLAKYFRNVQFLGQRIHPASSIWPIGSVNDASFDQFVIERAPAGFDFIAEKQRVPRYFIAIAYDNDAAQAPSVSVLLDQSDSLLEEKDQERVRQVTEREEAIRSLEKAVKWREGQIQQLTEGLEWTQGCAAETEKALAWRLQQVDELSKAKDYWERESATLNSQLQNTQRQLAAATDTLTGIYESRGWKLILKLRYIRDRFMGLLKARPQA